MTEQVLYWMWLQNAIHQGTATTPRVLKHFSTVDEIYRADKGDYRYVGMPDDTLDALCDKSLDNVKKLAERALKNGWILTPDSADYPAPLKHLFSPPLVLYGRGVLPDFERMPTIGIVGTRKCTEYGMEAAGSMAAGLAAVGCPIISGGARGIDRAAHEGAMYGGGKTVAIQACGLDVDYPSINRYMREDIVDSGGALLSEYPPGTTVSPSVFQVRNRLISGLSWGVCVVEAPMRSGALMTARLARDQGKDVFAVPGAITSAVSAGCNKLIRDGACLVSAPSHILSEYQLRCGDMLDEQEADVAQQMYLARPRRSIEAPQVKDNTAPLESNVRTLQPLPNGVSDSCRRVYEVLSNDRLSAELIFEKTNLPLGEIFSVLTELEIYGCVLTHPGQQYSR